MPAETKRIEKIYVIETTITSDRKIMADYSGVSTKQIVPSVCKIPGPSLPHDHAKKNQVQSKSTTGTSRFMPTGQVLSWQGPT